MIDRRTFATLVAGAFAAPGLSWAEDLTGKTVFYASIGPALSLYDLDTDGLIKRSTITAPANIQYAWPHPSRKYFYIVSSNGGPGVAGDKHFASAFRVDPTTGALSPHGQQMLPSRPIHTSVDQAGQYLLIAYNDPSSVTVHRLNDDGTIGDLVKQPEKLDTGIYAHQIRATPSNQMVILVTRGNNAEPGKPEDPGAIKTFGFKNGILTPLASIAPGNGLGFGPRHLDFHPTRPWVFVSIERQSQLYVYRLDTATGLSREPLFVKSSLSDPNTKFVQAAGPIHVHPNGRFVYQTNRASPLIELNGQKVLAGGENNIAVHAIDQSTGEPKLIQNIDGRGVQLRTFGIDPSGHLLVAASVVPIQVREGSGVGTLPAGLSVYRVGDDGKLDFVRKYDVEATNQNQQFWSGMVTLA
jgi:6-phosphogluconolactonase (cycloisomerase 2 family)